MSPRIVVRHNRGSSKSRTSSQSDVRDTKEKIKDCCRQLVAFMCTQVGVGGLVIGYTLIGAVSFMKIETVNSTINHKLFELTALRTNYSVRLFKVAEKHNVFSERNFSRAVNTELKQYQDHVVTLFRHGYDERPVDEIWTFPAALMYSLSIITMIGYGNLVPKTPWGKIATVIYAVFGIPLYVLYFLNMGEVLAGCFRIIYRWLYNCSTEQKPNQPPKRIIVPSTACLWVIGAYVITGAIMFAEWEKWSYLNSIYFCVTSLCKIGFGDLVPGADVTASNAGNQTKLVINFVYMLFGMGLVAMCYNLMREEIRVKMTEMKEDFSQCLEDTRIRLFECCNRVRGVEIIEY